jgi:hypothetical protein
VYGGLKGCMVPTMYPDPDVCEPRESFDPPFCSTESSPPQFRLSFRASQRGHTLPRPASAGKPSSDSRRDSTTEVIDTTTTAIRHEALIFSLCCPPHCDHPISPLQPRLCDPRPRKSDYCEIGSVLQHTTNYHRYFCSNCTFFRLQTDRTAAQDGVHQHQEDQGGEPGGRARW